MAQAWHIKRGSTVPQVFRWKDRSGPVDMTGMALHARLVSWDGSAVELSSEDPAVEILEQTGDAIGFFSIALTEEQRDQLRMEASGLYYFTAILPDGTKYPFAKGPLLIELGDGAHA